MLALADPSYPEADRETPKPAPPDTGIAVVGVVPNGNADLNGVRPGDVLLSYAGTTLKEDGDLQVVAANGGQEKKVLVKYWRDGITREVEAAAGRLDVWTDPRSAKAAVIDRRAADRILVGCVAGCMHVCRARGVRSIRSLDCSHQGR